MIKTKVSDIADRFAILAMKAKYSPDAEKELESYSDEMTVLLRIADGNNLLREFLLAIVNLSESNAKTWENEAAIRNEYPADPASGGKPLDFAEIGKRAVAIREHNKDRLEAKRKIDVLFGDVSDVKIDHASQDKP
jgi:hypothetical protein